MCIRDRGSAVFSVGICEESCPSGFLAISTLLYTMSTNTSSCLRCDRRCRTCMGHQMNCTSCPDNHSLIGGHCIKNCTEAEIEAWEDSIANRRPYSSLNCSSCSDSLESCVRIQPAYCAYNPKGETNSSLNICTINPIISVNAWQQEEHPDDVNLFFSYPLTVQKSNDLLKVLSVNLMTLNGTSDINFTVLGNNSKYTIRLNFSQSSLETRILLKVSPQGTLQPVGLKDFRVDQRTREFSFGLEPREFISQEDQDQIISLSEMVETHTPTAMGLAAFFAIFKGVSAFWSILDAMQYIQLLQLVDLRHPPNIECFLLGLSEFNFDLKAKSLDFFPNGAVNPPIKKYYLNNKDPKAPRRFHYLGMTASFLNNCLIPLAMLITACIIHLLVRILFIQCSESGLLSQAIEIFEFTLWAKLVNSVYLNICLGVWLQLYNVKFNSAINIISTLLAILFLVLISMTPYALIHFSKLFLTKKYHQFGSFLCRIQTA
eukprot:TRINITY_DN1081_c0_g1_i3.p1 TRINITY_DN1081_c0_g1~~TRINITY_DN1081_c0_g1_i3.p1  ORF type:complete len:488 (+),score=61.61 TRINITY_DN1081_c0_g1_i3:65-1528(+)